jgi:hypothetical protein
MVASGRVSITTGARKLTQPRCDSVRQCAQVVEAVLRFEQRID